MAPLLCRIGACLGPACRHAPTDRDSVLAFFAAVGVAAHALDELHGHPLRTRIPDPRSSPRPPSDSWSAVALGDRWGVPRRPRAHPVHRHRAVSSFSPTTSSSSAVDSTPTSGLRSRGARSRCSPAMSRRPAASTSRRSWPRPPRSGSLGTTIAEHARPFVAAPRRPRRRRGHHAGRNGASVSIRTICSDHSNARCEPCRGRWWRSPSLSSAHASSRTRLLVGQVPTESVDSRVDHTIVTPPKHGVSDPRREPHRCLHHLDGPCRMDNVWPSSSSSLSTAVPSRSP